MREITITDKDRTYHVGKQSENDTMLVKFPVGKWLEDYPGCNIHMAYKRWGDSDFYDVQNVEIIDNYLVWTVKTVDVEKVGQSVVELKMLRGEQVECSVTYTMFVEQSATYGEEPSEPVKEYYLHIIELEDKVIEAIQHYPRISEDNQNWLVWDTENSEWVDTGIRARGSDAPQIDDAHATLTNPWSGSKVNELITEIKANVSTDDDVDYIQGVND